MATKLSDIRMMVTQETRPCWFWMNGNKFKCLWHMFRAGEALVEFDDGRLEWRKTYELQFVDSKEKFAEYDWGDED